MKARPLIASGLAVLALTACDVAQFGGSSAVETTANGKTKESDPPGVTFTLDGTKLRVVVANGAPAGLTSSSFDAFCGTKEEFGPFGASARALGQRFPEGQREVTVTLSENIEDEVAFCGIEADDGAEAFAYFIPLNEILEG